MISKKAKRRLLVLILFLSLLVISLIIVINSLKKSIVYFISPTEIAKSENMDFNKKIRIGGMVKKKSINANGNSIDFIISDFDNEIYVTYMGEIPNLFSEGKGVVAEGKLRDKNFFIADKILAKHDENYMPPEVKNIIQKKN